MILTQPFATAHTSQISQLTSSYYKTSSRSVCAQLGQSYKIPLNSKTCFSVYYMSTHTFCTDPDHVGIIYSIIIKIQLVSSQETQKVKVQRGHLVILSGENAIIFVLRSHLLGHQTNSFSFLKRKS